METLKSIWGQFVNQFAGMPASQKWTVGAVVGLVVVGLASIIIVNRGPAEEALLGGKVFSAEELRVAQDALRQAGMTEFRVESQKIYVPKTEVARYGGALIEKGGLPAKFGEEMAKVHELAGIFAGEKAREQMLELAKQRELSKIVKAIPGIEDAFVVWERSKMRPFGGRSKVTASVNVKPRAGHELSPDLVHSLRIAVAGAVADLAADDVTVLNMTTGMAYRPADKDDPFNAQYIDHVKKFISLHQRNIAEALAYIPNVIVSVNVDLENLKTSWEQQREFGTKGFPYRTVEQTQAEKSNERRPVAEPGVKSNQPKDVRQTAGLETGRSSDKNSTSTESIPATARVTERTFLGMLPKSVQVSVSIPKDYYRAIAVKQGESEQDKQGFQMKVQQLQQETEKEIVQKISRLIPTPAGGTATDVINVTSYVRLESDLKTQGDSLPEQMTDLLSRWGSSVGLAVFALWALFMLNRSMAKLPPIPAVDPSNSLSQLKLERDSDEDEDDATPQEVTKRDKLQLLVRDNPEMAASVLSRWAQSLATSKN